VRPSISDPEADTMSSTLSTGDAETRHLDAIGAFWKSNPDRMDALNVRSSPAI